MKKEQVILCGQVYIGKITSGGTLYPEESKGTIAFHFRHEALAKYGGNFMDFEITLKNPVPDATDDQPPKTQEVRLKE